MRMYWQRPVYLLAGQRISWCASFDGVIFVAVRWALKWSGDGDLVGAVVVKGGEWRYRRDRELESQTSQQVGQRSKQVIGLSG